MPMKVRMQVYLTRELYHKLKGISRRSGKPMAEFIRESLVKYLEETDQAKTLAADPVWDLAGRGSSDVSDLAERHDHYLYPSRSGEND